VANRALRLAHRRLVVTAWQLGRLLLGNTCVALHAQLPDDRTFQHFRISRAVRYMTNRAALDLQRTVLENERALFVRVAFYAGDIGADRKVCLLRLKPAMRVVTIGAFHRAFEHLVMEWFSELRFRFVVAAQAQLGLSLPQHFVRRLLFYKCYRSGSFSKCLAAFGMRSVAIVTADIVPKVLAASKIVMALFARVANKTRFGRCFFIKRLERNDLGFVAAAFDVSAARAVT
jgi:hypothetical protein